MGPMTHVLLAWNLYMGEHMWVLILTFAGISGYEEKRKHQLNTKDFLSSG